MTTPTGYEYSTTFGQVKHELARRLTDGDKVHWKDSELGWYVNEALQTWNIFARYYRARGFVAVAASDTVIDVEDIIAHEASTPVVDYSPISLEMSGQGLLKAILLHLQEARTTAIPAVAGLTTHIDPDVIQDAIINATNQVLMESQAVIKQFDDVLTEAGNPRISIPNDLINPVRIELVTLEGEITLLERTSKQEDQHWNNPFAPTWNATSKPKGYAIETLPNLSIELTPWPDDIYKVRIYGVASQNLAVDLFSTEATFSFPAEWWWAVKYQALSIIYSTSGPSMYPQLAAYCSQRAKQAIAMMKEFFYIEAAWVNEQPLEIAPTAAADYFSLTQWRSATVALELPKVINMLGSNLGYLNKGYVVDPAEGVEVKVDVLRDAPMMVDEGDVLALAPEHLRLVIDYAQHLAAMKMGGSEFEVTSGLFKGFIEGSQVASGKRYASLIDRKVRKEKRLQQEEMSPTNDGDDKGNG